MADQCGFNLELFAKQFQYHIIYIYMDYITLVCNILYVYIIYVSATNLLPRKFLYHSPPSLSICMYIHMHTHRHRSIDRSLTSFVDHAPFRLPPNISKPSNFPCAIQILLDYTVIPSYTWVLVVNDFSQGFLSIFC